MLAGGLLFCSQLLFAQLPEAEVHKKSLQDKVILLEQEAENQADNVLMGLTLGHQYYLAGDYTKAEPFYLKALDEDLLMLKDQFQLVQILIENENLSLAREINSLSQEHRPMMHRLSEEVIQNASGRTPQKFFSTKAMSKACSPVEYMNQLVYRTDGGIFTERTEHGLRIGTPAKISGLNVQDIRHGTYHPMSGQLWATHASKDRFTLSTLSQKSAGTYHKPSEFEWSDGKSNYVHVIFNSSGSVMIFASDMPGGQGGYDLYRSIWTNGKWSKPVNLGPEINSERNELFPYLDAENRLYFSSNSYPSMGGYDLYSVALDEEEFVLSHLAPPFNSRGNEFGITALSSTEWFISSDRDGGLSVWRMWQKNANPVHPGFLFKGKVTDNSGKGIADALLLWGSEDEGAFARSDSNGNFEIRARYLYAVPKMIEVYKSGFKDTIIELKASQFSDKISTLQTQVYVLHKRTEPVITKNNPPKQPAPIVKEDPKPATAPPITPEEKPEVTTQAPVISEPLSYYAVLHSSKIEAETEQFIQKNKTKYPGLVNLPSASGNFRAVIPLGTDKSVASKKVIEYKSFIKDCWLLRQ